MWFGRSVASNFFLRLVFVFRRRRDDGDESSRGDVRLDGGSRGVPRGTTFRLPLEDARSSRSNRREESRESNFEREPVPDAKFGERRANVRGRSGRLRQRRRQRLGSKRVAGFLKLAFERTHGGVHQRRHARERRVVTPRWRRRSARPRRRFRRALPRRRKSDVFPGGGKSAAADGSLPGVRPRPTEGDAPPRL